MKFYNDSESIRTAVSNGETFKTTTYWRHSLIAAGIVNNAEWSLRYSGNYITCIAK